MATAVKDKKFDAIFKLYDLFGKYKQIVIVTLENVGSLQTQQVRRELSKQGALLVIGKNTLIRKALTFRIEGIPEGAEYDKFRAAGGIIKELTTLRDEMKGKVGLVFTNLPVFQVKTTVEANKVGAPARIGILAPIDVTVPAGPTGMDPSQISFFHALQISTKIVKGQIEITKDFPVCVAGRKIGSSEVALLQKMNIKPFSYCMSVLCAYDSGSILDSATCSLTPDDILKSFQTGVKNLTALSLQTGIATQLSVPHAISNAFKNLAAIGFSIDYKFKQIANAGTAVQQAPEKKAEAPAKVEKKEEPKKEEPKEEEDFNMGGLFD